MSCGDASSASTWWRFAAARRWGEVTSTDYVGALLERAKERATAERLAIAFQEADAESLPFGDGRFDVVLSTFGVMFTPNQEKAASELVWSPKGPWRLSSTHALHRAYSNARFRNLGLPSMATSFTA